MDDAIKCYTTAIRIRPSFADAYSNLAGAYKVRMQACYSPSDAPVVVCSTFLAQPLPGLQERSTARSLCDYG